MIRPPPRRFLLRRTGALGDVIAATPIVRRLKLENPDAEIDFLTHYANVFWGNRYVTHVGPNPRNVHYDRFWDLDGVHEATLRHKCTVDANSLAVFGDERTSRQVDLTYGKPPQVNGFDWDRTIAIYPARSWPQRTLPLSFWLEVNRRIISAGFTPVMLGTRQDWQHRWGERVCNTIGKLTLAEQAAVINACRAFVGSESGLLIVAQATKTPVLALITMGNLDLVQHERCGKLGWGLYSVAAGVPCVGCAAQRDEPYTYFDCKFAGTEKANLCVKSFDPVSVADKAVEIAIKT